MASWGFVALGTPASQGSKKAYLDKAGRVRMVESSPALHPWREAVIVQAPPGPCLDGPVAVYCVFTLRRPTGARKRDVTPCKLPDLDKLMRGAFDAITQAGLVEDDARIAEVVRLAKVWPGYDDDALDTPGMLIAAAEMDPRCGWRGELMAKVDVTMSRYRLDRVNRITA